MPGRVPGDKLLRYISRVIALRNSKAYHTVMLKYGGHRGRAIHPTTISLNYKIPLLEGRSRNRLRFEKGGGVGHQCKISLTNQASIKPTNGIITHPVR